MELNSATMPGSCFRKEFRCTKCGVTKWVGDVEPIKEEAADTAAAPADDRAARRAARKAAREAKAEAEE